MLNITIPATEQYDPVDEVFHNTKETQLTLEHSLVSISKWESRWCKPFLGTKKNDEETLDYIRCMTITKNVDPIIYICLSSDVIDQVNRYINLPMTATWFAKQDGPPSKEIITSELIYYWMTAFNIAYDCHTWHLNRLLTLIRVCNVKTNPPKKMSRQELIDRNRSLNEQRKNAANTKG